MPNLSLDSCFGPVTVCADEDALVAITWGWAQGGEATPLLSEAAEQLKAHFAGRLRRFSLPLRPPGSEFRQRVWSRLRAISYGETETYGALAQQLATSPRAVARACAANPLPIVIPCHRVIAARGRLGGYSGGDGLATKAALLALEGAPLPLSREAPSVTPIPEPMRPGE
jgi:methylated-DNA-[protein]-cysteine S-methyltransferase